MRWYRRDTHTGAESSFVGREWPMRARCALAVTTVLLGLGTGATIASA